MNLYRMLLERAAANRPLRVGMIGAGKFGSMYLAQAKHTPGIHNRHCRFVAGSRPELARSDGLAGRSVYRDVLLGSSAERHDVHYRRCAGSARSARDRYRR
jgi:hypothetical protein